MEEDVISEDLIEERQVAELEALEAIFEGDPDLALEFTAGLAASPAPGASSSSSSSSSSSLRSVKVTFSPAVAKDLELASVLIRLPRDYPGCASPHIDLGSKFLSDKCESVTREIVSSCQGEECLFQVIQCLKDAVQEGKEDLEERNRILEADPDLADIDPDADGVSAREDGNSILVISGEPLCERKSTFQAHVASVTSLAEVERVMEQLLEISFQL